MGKIAFHCGCGERLSADDPQRTIRCKQCGQTVDVPGGADGRLEARTPVELSSALSGAPRPRGGDPRRAARSSRRTAVPPPPNRARAWAVVGIVGVVAVVAVAVAASSGRPTQRSLAPLAEAPPRATPQAPVVTATAVARFCDDLPERARAAEVDGDQRRALEDRVRARARAHFAPEGMARVELDTLVDKHLRTWVSIAGLGSD